MEEHLRNQMISLADRQSFITKLACFSGLAPKETATLALLFVEKKARPGEIIVTEGDLVDNIYIIASGTAEVSQRFVSKRKLSKKLKITHVPIAILSKGEAIGLNHTGFFSETGKRTASVTAMTTMVLLSIAIKELHLFFQQHPHLQSSMDTVAEKMLRVQLIKQSLPFSRLSYERLEWLAEHIRAIHVTANTLIFSQGDKGDRCYLIREGEVEIFAKEDNGQEHTLMILRPPTLFGEATLMTHSRRNANAKALTHCQLLELQHDYLSELLESESNTADMFMTLMLDRSRPSHRSAISAHHRVSADHQDIVILKNSHNGTYFKLSPEGYFIWQQLDGKQTLQEITMGLANKYNIFSPEMVAGLISKLAKNGFIQNSESLIGSYSKKQAGWVRALLCLRNILEAKVAFSKTNQWLTYLYNKIGHFFFTKCGFILLLFLAMSGVIAFGLATHFVIPLFKSLHSTWLIVILLIPFTIISVTFHELGHAFATQYYGHEVHYMGVGWYWFHPVAFTDTSDMWLSTRWPRVIVNLAGIYSDMVTAGMAALCIFVISNSYVQCFLWLCALYTYINAFRMLSPLQDLDGYYILMDLFDSTRLRHSAVVWLVKDFPKAISRPILFKAHAAEVCYWLMCIIYLICITLMTLLVQNFILHILGVQSYNPLLSLILPFLVVLLSSLNIIADIRSQTE
jgi:putative peptide zinc metalloprotease protein